MSERASEEQTVEYEAQDMADLRGESAMFVELQERRIPVETEPESESEPVAAADQTAEAAAIVEACESDAAAVEGSVTAGGILQIPIEVVEGPVGATVEKIEEVIEVPVEAAPEPLPEVVSVPVEVAPQAEPVVIPVSVVELLRPESLSVATTGKSTPDLAPAPPPPTPAEPLDEAKDAAEEAVRMQLLEPTMRQIDVLAAPPETMDVPIAVEEEAAAPAQAEKPSGVVKYFEPIDASRERPAKKSRREIVEEVQQALAAEFDKKAQRPAPREPSYITYSSIVPERFFGHAYTPFSAFVSPEAKYRNRYTVDYVYQPPGSVALGRFDDLASVGPFGQRQWSTDRVVQRSRSFERRSLSDVACGGPLRRQSSLSAIRTGAVGGYLPRASSSSRLSDYARMAKYELKRGYGRVFYQEDDFRSPLPEKVSQAITRHFADPLYQQTQAERTDNYLRRLHTPYETTVPSYYRKYTGRPYNPHAVSLQNDHLYPTSLYPSSNIGKWMENADVPSGVRSYYQSKIDGLARDMSRQREYRQKIDRNISYANSQLFQSADTRHVVVPSEFALDTIYTAQNRFNVSADRQLAGYYPLRPFTPGLHVRLYNA